ncbi:mitotic spindle positioning protein meduse isoform 1-T1 [Glossina fuscipes fuscipes]
MEKIGRAYTKKIDPLVRIQEEIKEVERREQEYRQLISSTSSVTVNDLETEAGNNNTLERGDDDDRNDSSLNSLSPIPLTAASFVVSEDGNCSIPSLALSVNSTKDDGHHSDDSGISASSVSPIHGVSANIKKLNEAALKVNVNLQNALVNREHRYIGPNCYALTPEPPQQKLITRTVSTPHLDVIKKSRQFAPSPAHKGVMQRFIASRGKLQICSNKSNVLASKQIYLNGKNAAAILGLSSSPSSMTPPNTPASPPVISNGKLPDFSIRSSTLIPSSTLTPPVVERDSEGRPIRPGYVPVELKIQRELQDLKTRESELKKIRKIRQSTSDLLDSIDNENVETDDDDDDSEVEHCYGPGKLRAAKSIGDMCDSSPSASPLPDYDKQRGMRPAMSLAQLCDLNPEEAPSSRGLIAQWESLIQQNA